MRLEQMVDGIGHLLRQVAGSPVALPDAKRQGCGDI